MTRVVMSSSKATEGQAQSSSAPCQSEVGQPQSAPADARRIASTFLSSATSRAPLLVSSTSTYSTTSDRLTRSAPGNHAGNVSTAVENGPTTTANDINTAPVDRQHHQGDAGRSEVPAPESALKAQRSTQHRRKMSPEASPFKPSPPSNSQQGFSRPSSDKTNTALRAFAGASSEPLWSRTPSGEKVTFTTDMNETAKYQGGHYGKLMNVPKTKYDETMAALMEKRSWMPKLRCHRAIVSSIDENNIDVFLCFDHLHHTEDAFREVNSLVGEGNLDRSILFHKIDQSEYELKAPEDETTRFDGQVCVGVFHREIYQSDCPQAMSSAVFDLARKSGEILSFAQASAEKPTVFRVEFYEVSAAKDFAQTVGESGEASIGDWTVAAWAMTELLMHTLPEKPGPRGHRISPSGRSAWAYDRHSNQYPTQPPNTLPRKEIWDPRPASLAQRTPQRPEAFGSAGPSNNLHTPFNHSDGLGPLSDSKRSNARGDARNENFKFLYDPDIPEPYQGDATHVLKWKIASGVDVRTTIMLRNLPNNFTYRDMKEILNIVSFGKYDFSYLRIDFTHSMNVGYGFVNFISPSALLEFIEQFGNKKWNHFKSSDSKGRDRDARFSYATIQGYDCLIDKFRNSAVMDETTEFRPKVWYTWETAPAPDKVGKEKDFPATNNESKKKRSVDNAAQIGLYSNNRRSERRGRHSQYDRGTSAQMREDALISGQMGHSGPVGYQMPQSGYLGYNQMPQNGQMGWNNQMCGQNGQMGFYQMPANGQVAFQANQNGQLANTQMLLNNSVGYIDQTAYNAGYNHPQGQYSGINIQGAASWSTQDWSQGLNTSPPPYGGFQYSQYQYQQPQYQSQNHQYPATLASMDSSSDPFTDPRPSGQSLPYQGQSMSRRGFGPGQSRPSHQFGPMYSGGRPTGGPVMAPYNAAAAAVGAHVPRTIPPQEGYQYHSQQYQHHPRRSQQYQQQQYQQHQNQNLQLHQQQQQDGDLSRQFSQTSFFGSSASESDHLGHEGHGNHVGYLFNGPSYA